MLQMYVNQIDEACTGSGDFIVTFKPERKEQVFEKIFNKCNITTDITIGVKGHYKGTSITFFKTGKLILYGLNGIQAAKALLRELLG
jgi:hypothetical protein